jgi:hypothetical protein
MAQPCPIRIAPQRASNSVFLPQVPAVTLVPSSSTHDRYAKASTWHSHSAWERVKSEVTKLALEQNLGPRAIEEHFCKKVPPFIAK